MDAMELYGEMDLDPTNTTNFYKTVVEKSSAVSMDPLVAARSLPKLQPNPFSNIDVRMNQVCVAEAPPQSGKTAVEAYLAMKAGVSGKMVSVTVTQNKTPELARLGRGFGVANDTFADCCTAVGSNQSPMLRVIYPSGSTTRLQEFKQCFQRWKSGRTQDIPVYILLLNASKMDNLKEVVEIVGSDPLRDENGKYPIHLLFGEGDLAIKSSDKSTSFEKALYGDGGGDLQFTSLLDSISCVTYVTASIPALLLNDMLWAGCRAARSVRINPSKNYHGYEEGFEDPAACNIIERKEGILEDYLTFVTASTESQAALVYTSSMSGIKGRIEHARETAVKYQGIKGLVTMSWSADKLDVFTSDLQWQKVLDSSRVSFRKTVGDNGVAHYKSTKANRAISDYPSCITFMLERARKLKLDGILKSILFGKEMVDRGVSICGLNHEHHLDSMFVDMTTDTHAESFVQVCGRLCSVETATTKTLWASKDMHNQHKKSILINSYCAKRLGENAFSVWDILRDLQTKVAAADDGVVVEDISGVYLMHEGNVSRLSVGKRLKQERGLVEASARKKRVTVADVELGDNGEPEPMPSFEPEANLESPPFQPTTAEENYVEQQESPPLQHQEDQATTAEENYVEQEESPGSTMRDFFENYSSDLTTVLGDVEPCGTGMAMGKFAEVMAGHAKYPSTDLSAIAVLKYVVEHREDVLAAANVFCFAGVLFPHEFDPIAMT